MLRGFFGNLIFAIITRMLCGNHLNFSLNFSFQASDEFTFYDVSVDWEGLTVRVESSQQGTS